MAAHEAAVDDAGAGAPRIDSDPAQRTAPRILHVVSRVTDEVFSFLGPAARALSHSGHRQTIVLIDHDRHRHNAAQLEDSATLVRVEPSADPVMQWRRVFDACRADVARGDVEAVHVHGMVPFAIAAVAMRSRRARARLVYSPHGSRTIERLGLFGRLAIATVNLLVRTSGSSAIVTVSREAHAVDSWIATELVESPVHDAFLGVERNESPSPLVVSGGRHSNVRSLEVFSQLAVLLSGEELGLRFHWLGSVDASAQTWLTAAAVEVFEVEDEVMCALAYSAGWIYVAPWSTRGFPLFLAQAMAAGLPCVALDCAQHREVIEHRTTGFLCGTAQEMVATIALLVDDAALRLRIGNAARATALARFREVDFGARLLSAYPQPAPLAQAPKAGAA